MGLPKGELRLEGRPVLPLLLQRFDWPGPTLLVTAPGREHPTGWENFTLEVTDPSTGEGPLRGVLTAIERSPTPVVVITAVDMPCVQSRHLHWLITQLSCRPDAIAMMPKQRGNDGGRAQPFPSAFRTDAAPLVRRLLAAKRRSLHGLLDDPSVVAIEAPADWGDEVWTNLNTPADVHALGARPPTFPSA